MIFKQHASRQTWKLNGRIADRFKPLRLPFYLTLTTFLLVLGVLNPLGISKPSPDSVQPMTVSTVAPQANPIPILAYYYIWFDVKSWDRAKTDIPLLGRYSSDEVD